LGHDLVGYGDTGGIGIQIESGSDFQAGGGAGCANQTDDGLEIDEWPTAPMNADVREQAMLDLVPLAGARWQMADRDRKVLRIGQALEPHLPETTASAIASSLSARTTGIC
jgi:hypothetical protein